MDHLVSTILIQISRVLNHVPGLVRISCSNFPSYCLIQSASSLYLRSVILDILPGFYAQPVPNLGSFSVHVIRRFGNWVKLTTNHIWEPPFPENAKYASQLSPRGHLNGKDPIWVLHNRTNDCYDMTHKINPLHPQHYHHGAQGKICCVQPGIF